MTHKSLTGYFLLQAITNEIQLVEYDLGRQNIFGQNKGLQR